ncbi:rho GTPase-activating protein 7-like [Arapaima gigas]
MDATRCRAGGCPRDAPDVRGQLGVGLPSQVKSEQPGDSCRDARAAGPQAPLKSAQKLLPKHGNLTWLAARVRQRGPSGFNQEPGWESLGEEVWENEKKNKKKEREEDEQEEESSSQRRGPSHKPDGDPCTAARDRVARPASSGKLTSLAAEQPGSPLRPRRFPKGPRSVMPVAIRGRSLEDRVTVGAVLKYSYDDLDVDSCNGAIRRIPALAGDVGEGRRARCSSLPGRSREACDDGCWFTLEGSRAWVSHQEAEQSESLTDKVGRPLCTPNSLEDPDPFEELPEPSPSNGCISKEGLPHTEALQTGCEEDGEGNSTQGHSEAHRHSPTSLSLEDHTVQRQQGSDEDNTLERCVSQELGGPLSQVHTPPLDNTATRPEIIKSTSFSCGDKDCRPPEPSKRTGPCGPAEVQKNSEVQEVTATGQSALEDAVHVTSARNINQEGQGTSEHHDHSISGYTVTAESVCSPEALKQTVPEAQRDPGSNAGLVPAESMPDAANERHKDTGANVGFEEESCVSAQSRGTPEDCDARPSAGTLLVEIPDRLTAPEQRGVNAGGFLRTVPCAQGGGDGSRSPSLSGNGGHTGTETGDRFGPPTGPAAEAERAGIVSGGEAADGREEDGTVKLRRKGPKVERGHSRLDSMVLLIMKLDQLDHDIDDALSGASCRPERAPSDFLSFCSLTSYFLLLSPSEVEAKEACTWLRAAGFPQYAQLYEDGQFPIDISSVTWDHDFLDRDAIEALCRRLNTLNKCTMMRLEISPQRKQSEDSDEDEPCAISGRWTFQRDSKRWSRLEELEVFSPSVESPDIARGSAESLLTEQDWCRGGPPSSVAAGDGATRAGSLASVCSSGTSGATEDSPSEGLPSPSPSPPSPNTVSFPFDAAKPASKSARSRARSFLRRMESLRLRGASSRRRKKSVTSKLEISGPVLRQGPDEERLRRLNCVDVAVLRERSVSCSAEPRDGHSGGSGGSSGSGSSAVSTPSPVTRTRSHSSAACSAKRAGMYLEGFNPFSLLQLESVGVSERNQRVRKAAVSAHEDEEEEEEEEEEVMFFLIPEGHKPGTFPKALCDGRLASGNSIRRRGSTQRRSSAGSLDSRLSFYDNVPPQEEVEEEESLAYKLDKVLRSYADVWVERAAQVGEEGDSDSALDSASPCPSSPLQSHLEEAENGSDLDSTLNEQDETLTRHERRDSGVGASLTRSNRPPKLRWPSFQSSHRPSLPSAPLQVSGQSVLQMNLLQKFSLLKLTALLEKHAPTHKQGFSWAVPKFMKRTKVREHRGCSVFGVPLRVNVQRTGQPLPLGIQQAMRYLRSQCLDQVGLFRKSGVKSRIQALRQMNEACPEGVSYEGQSAYDVADMLKQYFRDLPEPLLTSKLSETFLQIYQYVPKEQRLQAAKAATLLLPDENREALQALLCFLSDVAAAAAENQMTCTNLAVCLAPSLFHLNTLRRDGSSPRVMQRKQSLGKPDQRDLNENLAATQGLAHMIAECRKFFQIPEEMGFCRDSYVEQGLPPAGLEELGQGSDVPSLQDTLESLQKEAKDRFRGYDSCSTPEPVELAYKKVHDGFPLRLWKASTEVPAPPEDVLTRVLRERHRWDEDLLQAQVLESLDLHTEVYQYVQDSMAPQPPRDHVVLRMWATDLPKGACALVCASVDHQGAPLVGVRANVLAARYFMEPCGPGRTRLTYLCRTDCRGHFPEWYNKVFGHWCAAEVARIRDSFASAPDK